MTPYERTPEGIFTAWALAWADAGVTLDPATIKDAWARALNVSKRKVPS